MAQPPVPPAPRASTEVQRVIGVSVSPAAAPERQVSSQPVTVPRAPQAPPVPGPPPTPGYAVPPRPPGYVPIATPMGGEAAIERPGFRTSKLSAILVWILALTPILGMLFPAIAAVEFGGQAWEYWWINVSLILVVSYVDEALLEKQGFPKFGLITGLVPVYLFQRAKVLGHRPTYAWGWIVSFLLSGIVAVIPKG